MEQLAQEMLEGRVLIEIENMTGEVVTKESLLTDDLYFDSLDMVELCMALEEEFEMEIPDADVPAWKSVQDVINYITKRMEEKG